MIGRADDVVDRVPARAVERLRTAPRSGPEPMRPSITTDAHAGLSPVRFALLLLLSRRDQYCMLTASKSMKRQIRREYGRATKRGREDSALEGESRSLSHTHLRPRGRKARTVVILYQTRLSVCLSVCLVLVYIGYLSICEYVIVKRYCNSENRAS